MLRTCLAITLLALSLGSTACAQQPPSTSSPRPVWVNLGSGVYHCPGTEHYGTTKRGEYIPETVAIDSGYRASGGRYCSPLAAAADSARVAVPAPPVPLPDSGPPAPATGLSACLVTKVRDGDTIECGGLGPVRLIGIDTPERDQEPYGGMATGGLLALVALRDTIQLSEGLEARDRYGRLLAYAWRDGVSVNYLMIWRGWAVALE